MGHVYETIAALHNSKTEGSIWPSGPGVTAINREAQPTTVSMCCHLRSSRAAAAVLAAVGAVSVGSLPANAQDAPPITVNGVLELNYTANFNSPANGSNTYLYNTKEGQFAVNLADLRIAKAATPTSRAGFFLRLIEGEVRQRNFIPGEANPGDPSELPFILEAFGTVLLPMGGKDVKVDVGQFVTHVGYETIDIGTNNFVSRNFLFQFPSPFYNAGVRAAYPLGSKTTATLFLLNRYNGNNDTGNRDIAPGFQVAQTLSGNSSVVLNFLTSRENLNYSGFSPTAPGGPGVPSQLNRQQSVVDLIYSNQFSKQLKLVLEGLYRFGKNQDTSKKDGDSYSVAGGALYLIYGLGRNTLALRAETLSSSKRINPVLPALPGDLNAKPSLSSITLSYELKSGILPGSRTIFEARVDSANKKAFPGKLITGSQNTGEQTEGTFDFKKSQTTLTIGQVFSF